jgi:membrane-bound ClpP family serine protease
MSIFSFFTDMTPLATILLLVGMALVIFEMFYPGLNAPGIMGSILLIGGVILTAKTFTEALILIIFILAILGIALTIVVHSVTKGHLSRVLILSETTKNDADSQILDDLAYFIGKECTSITPLRPSGIADLNGVRLDVISEGGFIEKDKKMVILRVDGKKIIVKEVDNLNDDDKKVIEKTKEN